MTRVIARKLRKNGHSFGEISKILEKSRQYIWRLSKDVKFDKNGEARYKKDIVNKYSNKIIPQCEKLSQEKVRIISHLLFDRTVFKAGYNHIARYINCSKELIDQFINDVEKVYGIKRYNLSICENKGRIHYKATFTSKEMYNDLLKYLPTFSTSNTKLKLPQIIVNSESKIQLEVIRAFWEDEGSISYKGRLCADLKNKNIIYQLLDFHKIFDIYGKMCCYNDKTGKTYKLCIHKNKENLTKFYNLKIFHKSRVSKGYNISKKKIDVLKHHIHKFKNNEL